MARRRKRLSDGEIQALCEQQITTAAGWYSGELADERATSMDLYLGEPQGDEVDGRSQVRTREVTDTVESVLPGLIRLFADADNVCEFEPVDAEDEEAAQLESDAVQDVFWKQERGFYNLYTFLKDGLLQKTGVLKVWWDDAKEPEREEYEGLNDWELAELITEPGIDLEVLEHEQAEDGTHSVVLKVQRESGQIQVQPCPPEEFGVDRDARSIYPEDSTFCYHRVRKTKSELIESGFDRKLVEGLPSSDDVETEERLARRHLDDEQEFYRSGEHWSMHRVWVSECYIRVDRDGDGIAELLKVTLSGAESGYSSGSTLLDVEDIDRVPFVVWSPVLLTHKFYGLSLADLVADLQTIKTTLVRQMLDSTYLANNGQVAINENVSVDDMLTSRPGGIKRVAGKEPPQNSIFPIPQQPFSPQAFDMLGYLDEMRQRRTGVGDEVAALDTGALANLNTGVAALAYDQARSRIELIARICAEVGLRPLFLRIHELLRKHQDKEKSIRMRGSWAKIAPQHWRERKDMTVKVGIGQVSRERRMVALSDVLQKQALAVQGGGMGIIVRPEHMQQAVNDYTRELGVEESKYWVAPGEMPPPQPERPDYEMAQLQVQSGLVEAQMQRNAVEARKVESTERVRMAELQLRGEEAMLKARLEAAKAEATTLKAQLEHVDKSGKVALEAQIAVREQQRKDAEVALEANQEAQRRETEMYRALLQSGTSLTIEQMKLVGAGNGGVSGLYADLEAQLQAAIAEGLSEMRSAVGEVSAQVVEMRTAKSAPITIERDADGRVISLGGKPIKRDERGLMVSVG
jgi:hypothetical protein